MEKRKELQRSRGGADGYVAAVVLIVIVIVVGVLFKEQISDFVTNFFTSITNISNNSFFTGA